MKSLALALATVAIAASVNAPAQSSPSNHPKAIMQPLNLAAMQLTRAEVADRDKRLAPIYQYYSQTNLAQVGNALEQQYGMNLYQRILGGDWNEQALTVKKGIMSAAVEYSIHTSSGYGLRAGYLLSRVDEAELGFKERILIDDPMDAGLVRVTGSKKNARQLSTSPFTFTSEIVRADQTVMQGFDAAKFLSFGLVKRPFSGFDSHNYTLFSSTPLLAVQRPQSYRLLLALRRANIRALDATIVFVNSKRLRVVDHAPSGIFAPVKSWAVVYPGFSRVAPIPQPIVYISELATDNDLDQLLKSEAPLIFAYNKLFDMQLLPATADIEQSIAKISRINPEVAKLAAEVGEANTREAARRSFLAVSYAILTTAKAPGAIAHDGAVLAAHTTRDVARFAYQNVRDIGEGITEILSTPTYNETFIYSPNFGIHSSMYVNQSVSYYGY